MPIVFAHFFGPFFFPWDIDVGMFISCLFTIWLWVIFGEVLSAKLAVYTEMHCRCNSDNNLNPFSSAPGSIRVTPCGIFCRHAILKCVTTLILNCNTVETTDSFCSLEFCLRQISPSYRWQKQLQGNVPRTRSFSHTTYVPRYMLVIPLQFSDYTSLSWLDVL